MDFDTFKNVTCRKIRRIGEIEFVKEILSNRLIKKYFDEALYLEGCYLLIIMDYLCRINDLPINIGLLGQTE